MTILTPENIEAARRRVAINTGADRFGITPGMLREMCDSHEALRARVQTLTDALRAVEWGWHHARCPCCHRPKAPLGHYPDCVLAAALGNAIPSFHNIGNTERP